jgi:hypothetical protein
VRSLLSLLLSSLARLSFAYSLICRLLPVADALSRLLGIHCLILFRFHRILHSRNQLDALFRGLLGHPYSPDHVDSFTYGPSG